MTHLDQMILGAVVAAIVFGIIEPKWIPRVIATMAIASAVFLSIPFAWSLVGLVRGLAG